MQPQRPSSLPLTPEAELKARCLAEVILPGHTLQKQALVKWLLPYHATFHASGCCVGRQSGAGRIPATLHFSGIRGLYPGDPGGMVTQAEPPLLVCLGAAGWAWLLLVAFPGSTLVPGECTSFPFLVLDPGAVLPGRVPSPFVCLYDTSC